MLAFTRDDYQALQVWWEIEARDWTFILRFVGLDYREMSGALSSATAGILELPGPRAFGREDSWAESRLALSRDAKAEKAEAIVTCLAVCLQGIRQIAKIRLRLTRFFF